MLCTWGQTIPGWVLPGASLDINFVTGTAYCPGGGGLTDIITGTRASTEYGLWADGHYSSFPSGVPVITDLGFWSFQASTNTALWCRDMTNAAWVKVNMTAALTATGIDNTLNSATTLTATSGNATILQTLTIASSAETYSVFLKRVSGSGTINITENGGTTWTSVVLTSAWTRFSVEATLANPVIGIQIVTNGDVIAADFNQTEALAFATSPILTTTTSVTRAADVWNLTGPAATAALAAKALFAQTNFGPSATISNRIIQFEDNSAVSKGLMLYSSVNVVQAQNAAGSGSGNAGIGGAGTITQLVKTAFGFDSSSITAIANGGTKASGANAWDVSTATKVFIGNRSAGDRALNSALQRLVFGPVKGAFDGLTV